MKGKHARKSIAALKLRPIRQGNGSAEELKSLARSWLGRAIHPIVCRPDLTVADGHRRLEGLKLLGETEVEVFITEEDLDDNQLTQIALTTAIHRADLTGYEKWQACRELLELNQWQGKELAEHLHLDPSSVTRLMSPSKCIPEAVEALKAGRITISDTYALSKLDQADQPGLLALKLSGASRDTLERQGRKTRAASAPAVRASKIKCPLVSGSVVTVAGDEISLDDAIEALKEAAKAMQKARDTGLDAKTAQAVWRDMALAGS
ncbi:ParB/RepB/Spo0J family partition protein [Paludisphaera mucosa]|uniref:ParB N-terminal domain-containing protein n=1 Tax=Paludisphaera mucosa TaxID=3030827 RepID=A0ABT6FFT1_9BACT|nr:ParB N-terminal domain-containing protein [Paludisphaera mucosa]MDG3006441.1 ParB N-terminal domain-containing protein [Paludisphaera mucosa]